LKDTCQTCPCFQVNGCDECPDLDEVSGCLGWYPAECTAEDCVRVKTASLGQTGISYASKVMATKDIHLKNNRSTKQILLEKNVSTGSVTSILMSENSKLEVIKLIGNHLKNRNSKGSAKS
jgi:hypothetical protein